MPIRLIKVSKILNVGIGTLVEFLHKKGIEIEENPNVKIENEQYNLLIAEFGKGMSISIDAAPPREPVKRSGETREAVALEGYELPEDDAPRKKAKKESIETEIPEEMKPHVNVVGSIDLDNANKKKIESDTEGSGNRECLQRKTAEVQTEKPVKKTEQQPTETKEAEEKQQPTAVEKPAESISPVKEEEEALIRETSQPSGETDETQAEASARSEKEKRTAPHVKDKDLSDVTTAPEKENAIPHPTEVSSISAAEGGRETEAQNQEEETENVQSDEVFRLHDHKIESNIVVKGTIDLTSINDRTRPQRKSRAQRKKERMERAQKNADNKKMKEENVKLLKKEAIDEKRKQTSTANAEIDTDGDTKKRKRKRIRSSKVNIDKQGNYNQSTRREKRGSLKKLLKTEVSEEDVQKQIKETLARLTEKRNKKGGAKYRREKREASAQRQLEEQKQQERESRILRLTEFVTANDLANMMGVSVTNVISTCMSIGVMVAINQRMDAETINIVAEEFGFKTEFVSADVTEAIAEEEDNPEDLTPRPPIVTVMGHVDHGKTSLLDCIRSTNVIAGEAGGITQHIGAYNVQLSDGRKITFLDTPGHEAFTAMRARGAKVTDVAIIIVAADDDVMPQTVEAINHASAAGVPIVFAINKIDKPGAHPDKIKEKLSEMNYLVEEWGGKYQSQDISAKKGIGIRELLEKVLLEADLMELKANPNRKAIGSIIESSLDKGRGYVATVLVENGTLQQGDIVLAGSYFGRIKAMFNERNQRIEEAGPSEPALILGLDGAPQAGDKFNVMDTEQEARSIANRREQLQREQSLRTQKMLTLDDIGRRIAIGNFQQLNIIVKGDVDGSTEALSDSLIQLSTKEIEVNVIHKAVGQISESDVTLAAASDAVIIGFQVRPSLSARKEAEKEGVEIRLYSIIYDAIEEVKAAMEGMLSPEIKEEITGNVEVLNVFKISKVGTVAGCMVRDGKIKRTGNIRLIRNGIVIFTGVLDSLKRFKDDVKEVTVGYECGLSIHNFNDIKVGDIIEAYEETEVKKTL